MFTSVPVAVGTKGAFLPARVHKAPGESVGVLWGRTDWREDGELTLMGRGLVFLPNTPAPT